MTKYTLATLLALQTISSPNTTVPVAFCEANIFWPELRVRKAKARYYYAQRHSKFPPTDPGNLLPDYAELVTKPLLPAKLVCPTKTSNVQLDAMVCNTVNRQYIYSRASIDEKRVLDNIWKPL